jgi:uncharacterized membrane protein YphA (DoxX/SURF4 family)
LLIAGSAFVISGLSKLQAPERFAGTVRRVFYLIRLRIDRSRAKVFAVGLSLTETMMGAALILGFHADIAAGVLIGLLVMFSGISLFAGAKSLYIPCNCFGGHDEGALGLKTLLRSLLLLGVISIYLAGADQSPGWSASTTKSLSQITIVGGCLVLASWLFRLPAFARMVKERRQFDPAELERSRFRSTSANRGNA